MRLDFLAKTQTLFVIRVYRKIVADGQLDWDWGSNVVCLKTTIGLHPCYVNKIHRGSVVYLLSAYCIARFPQIFQEMQFKVLAKSYKTEYYYIGGFWSSCDTMFIDVIIFTKEQTFVLSISFLIIVHLRLALRMMNE